MTPATIATTVILLGTILGATLALATLILRTSARLERRLERYEVGQSNLRERMAKIEAMFEGFTRRERGATASAAPGPP